MLGQKEEEKANMPVRRPSADLRFCVRPRTSIKIREYFHTLGGAATLKLGADYVFDPSKPEMHNLQIKTSLKDTFANAKILYSAGEVRCLYASRRATGRPEGLRTLRPASVAYLYRSPSRKTCGWMDEHASTCGVPCISRQRRHLLASKSLRSEAPDRPT